VGRRLWEPRASHGEPDAHLEAARFEVRQVEREGVSVQRLQAAAREAQAAAAGTHLVLPESWSTVPDQELDVVSVSSGEHINPTGARLPCDAVFHGVLDQRLQ
jgi:hypothetical protein